MVSEENGQVSLVQRARIVRNLNESQLARALRGLLEPNTDGARSGFPPAAVGHARLPDLGRADAQRAPRRVAPAEPLPPAEPMVAGARGRRCRMPDGRRSSPQDAAATMAAIAR